MRKIRHYSTNDINGESMNCRSLFEDMAVKYAGQLLRYCYERLGEFRYLAEDTAGDTMLVMTKKRDMFKSEEDFRAYLFRVADKCILHNASKEAKRSRNVVPFESTEFFVSSDADFPDELEAAKELCRMLPEEDRELFKSRFIDNKSLEQISRETSVPYSTVRLHIERIRKHVKEIISPEGGEGGRNVRKA